MHPQNFLNHMYPFASDHLYLYNTHDKCHYFYILIRQQRRLLYIPGLIDL